MSSPSRWKIWVDTGGTFTDCLAVDPRGQWHRAKVLSTSALRGTVEAVIASNRFTIAHKWRAPTGLITHLSLQLLGQKHDPIPVAHFDAAHAIIELAAPAPETIASGAAFELRSDEPAPVLAARLVTQTAGGNPLPAIAMRLATTRGTNALLERRGVPVALFVTRGFRDLLVIGTQQRPELFALDIRKAAPLYDTVVEVDERLDASGTVLQALDTTTLAETASSLLQRGIRAAAIAFLHSYRNPEHEVQLANFLRHQGFGHVACSAQLAPLIKILPRAQTAVVDAYIGPVIADYLTEVKQANRSGNLHVMTSAGGLMSVDAYHAKDSLLSGPAGGVVGAAYSAGRAGFRRIIAFDMGGTSTDVSRYDGDFEYVFEHRVGDAQLVAPALAIETVAAGGGSICYFDKGRLRVGPQSAGASPGPACYGTGGPLTLTDVNLLLGRLQVQQFEIPIQLAAAERAFGEVVSALQAVSGERAAGEQILNGFLDIANERMADAIRRISIRKGYDTLEYALLAFGGAGGQHACAVADLLGIETVLSPPDASLLSALGLGHAVIERFAQQQVLRPLSEVEGKLEEDLSRLARQAWQEVRKEGIAEENVVIRRRLVSLRFQGQEAALAVDMPKQAALGDHFTSQYAAMYGYVPENRAIEVESLRVVASSRLSLTSETQSARSQHLARPVGSERSYLGGRWRQVPAYWRDRLAPGAALKGPALIVEAHSAVVVPPAWQVEIGPTGTIIIRKGRP